MSEERRLKVLLSSNMYAWSGNWDKLDALARYVDLAVITPTKWGVPELGQMVHVPEQAPAAAWRQYRLATHIYEKGNPFRFFYEPGALRRVIDAERPDILHIEQEPESLALLEFNYLSRQLNTPLVFIAWEDMNPLRLGWGFRKLNYARADGGIFGNPVALARARKYGFRKLGEVIPQYGFEITYNGEPRRDDGRFVVGYAGRLVWEKGLETLVDATRAMPRVEVRLAGDGPLASSLAGEPHVKMLGWLPRSEIAEFCAQLDVLVLPSRTLGKKSAEQFGRVLVEAMAAGVPVIGSDAGSIPETIGDAGLIFREGDVAGLAAALDALRLNPAQRAELRGKGLARVQECYSNEVVMGRTVCFYRQVLATRAEHARSHGRADERIEHAPERT